MCVNNASGAVLPVTDCGSQSTVALEVSCNTQPCLGAYTWQVSSDWSSCSVACGVGTVTRLVQCVNELTGEASSRPTVDCPLEAPVATRTCPCNAGAFRSHAFVVSSWGPCSSSCGGTRSRIVSCSYTDASSWTTIATSVQACMATGQLPLLKTLESCNNCPFCSMTACSNNGVCDTVRGVCH